MWGRNIQRVTRRAFLRAAEYVRRAGRFDCKTAVRQPHQESGNIDFDRDRYNFIGALAHHIAPGNVTQTESNNFPVGIARVEDGVTQFRVLNTGQEVSISGQHYLRALSMLLITEPQSVTISEKRNEDGTYPLQASNWGTYIVTRGRQFFRYSPQAELFYSLPCDVVNICRSENTLGDNALIQHGRWGCFITENASTVRQKEETKAVIKDVSNIMTAEVTVPLAADMFKDIADPRVRRLLLELGVSRVLAQQIRNTLKGQQLHPYESFEQRVAAECTDIVNKSIGCGI